jgi:hypothetical protein
LTISVAARAELGLETGKILVGRIVVHLGLFLGVEVIEVAVELVEPVIGGQVPVEIPPGRLQRLSR